ncbi:unnamed protein product [Amoebophrya sp. A120]|nr:unnamed protein product [Amoebophrya sp. A120]|eukprot:GSA120T00012887001.1
MRFVLPFWIGACWQSCLLRLLLFTSLPTLFSSMVATPERAAKAIEMEEDWSTGEELLQQLDPNEVVTNEPSASFCVNLLSLLPSEILSNNVARAAGTGDFLKLASGSTATAALHHQVLHSDLPGSFRANVEKQLKGARSWQDFVQAVKLWQDRFRPDADFLDVNRPGRKLLLKTLSHELQRSPLTFSCTHILPLLRRFSAGEIIEGLGACNRTSTANKCRPVVGCIASRPVCASIPLPTATRAESSSSSASPRTAARQSVVDADATRVQEKWGRNVLHTIRSSCADHSGCAHTCRASLLMTILRLNFVLPADRIARRTNSGSSSGTSCQGGAGTRDTTHGPPKTTCLCWKNSLGHEKESALLSRRRQCVVSEQPRNPDGSVASNPKKNKGNDHAPEDHHEVLMHPPPPAPAAPPAATNPGWNDHGTFLRKRKSDRGLFGQEAVHPPPRSSDAFLRVPFYGSQPNFSTAACNFCVDRRFARELAGFIRDSVVKLGIELASTSRTGTAAEDSDMVVEEQDHVVLEDVDTDMIPADNEELPRQARDVEDEMMAQELQNREEDEANANDQLQHERQLLWRIIYNICYGCGPEWFYADTFGFTRQHVRALTNLLDQSIPQLLGGDKVGVEEQVPGGTPSSRLSVPLISQQPSVSSGEIGDGASTSTATTSTSPRQLDSITRLHVRWKKELAKHENDLAWVQFWLLSVSVSVYEHGVKDQLTACGATAGTSSCTTFSPSSMASVSTAASSCSPVAAEHQTPPCLPDQDADGDISSFGEVSAPSDEIQQLVDGHVALLELILVRAVESEVRLRVLELIGYCSDSVLDSIAEALWRLLPRHPYSTDPAVKARLERLLKKVWAYRMSGREEERGKRRLAELAAEEGDGL